jgi:hypothetical protein
MPRKKIHRPCECGCGEMTGGGPFRQGHDRRMEAAILKHLGVDILGLRDFIEKATGRKVIIKQPIARRG